MHTTRCCVSQPSSRQRKPPGNAFQPGGSCVAVLVKKVLVVAAIDLLNMSDNAREARLDSLSEAGPSPPIWVRQRVQLRSRIAWSASIASSTPKRRLLAQA
jgi:hypothetical protein